MPDVTRIRNVMIPVDRYPSVRDRATLREAIRIMRSSHLEVKGRRSLPRALLVFDEIGVLVGYVRRRDIMRGLEPKFLVSRPLEYRRKLFEVDVDPNLSELTFDRVRRGIRDQADRPVSDVMQPIEAILEADDHLMKAVYEMVWVDVALIPVVDEKKLVGVVRSVDVFQQMVQVLD